MKLDDLPFLNNVPYHKWGDHAIREVSWMALVKRQVVLRMALPAPFKDQAGYNLDNPNA